MSNLNVLRFVLFLVSNAEDITRELTELIAFARGLIEKYKAGQVEALGAVPENLGAWFRSYEDLQAQGEEPSATDVKALGIFRDFFKFVIENPEKAIAWLELILDLVGKKAES
jgi:hypothetical protein